MTLLRAPVWPHTPVVRFPRLVPLLAVTLLAALLLTACTSSSGGTKTSCNLDSCTITFDRGVDAKAEVLGVEVKLVKVKGDNVTLEVAGNRVTAKVGEPVNVQGFQVEVLEVTDDTVKVKITGGG